MTENIRRRAARVNLKMSVTVSLSAVIYIRNDSVCKRMTVMKKKKRLCARSERKCGERKGKIGGSKSSDTERGALRCGERIIQNPEYE